MADSSICSACVNAAKQGIIINPEEHTNTFYGELLDVSEATIRRHYQHGPEPKLGEKLVSMQTNAPDSEPQEIVEVSSTGARSVTAYAAIRDRPVTLQDARDWITSSGDNPDDFNFSIRAIAYGKDQFSNKLSAWPKPKKQIAAEIELVDALPDIDPVSILGALRKYPVWEDPTQDTLGDGVFVFSLNDTQFGKGEGGGTPATLARLEKSIDLAVKRITELRGMGRQIGTLVIIGGGDIVEGCTIYPNQSFSLDLDRRGQINTAVTAILNLIDRLAGYFTDVIVLAARGNHGENRINGNRTTLYDNDDTLVFEMAKYATDRDPTLSHVKYIIAESEAGVYVDVAGWRLATTHGDVYGKGVTGATQDKKAQAWYKNMSMARNPLGLADVLITHHFHHDKMSDWGSCLWRQTPALDGGSLWFEQTTGEYSQPGVLTFVMTPGSRYSDEAVLR